MKSPTTPRPLLWIPLVLLSVVFFLPFLSGAAPRQSWKDPAVLRTLQEAKTKLQAGVNTWNAALFSEARDLFIGCLIQAGPDNAYGNYWVALADFRLASIYIASGKAVECETAVAEGQKYAEKAMALDPEFAEAEALFGYLVGMELAFHPDRGMILGMKSMEHMARALTKEPANPRVQFLKGFYQLYVPEQYGGGADSALPFLEKAASLFETETAAGPLQPAWGREETLTTAALIYKQKGDKAKAAEWLKKALAVNPDYERAKAELASLEK